MTLIFCFLVTSYLLYECLKDAALCKDGKNEVRF